MNVDVRFLLAALRKAWAEVNASNPKPALRDYLIVKSNAQFPLVGSGAIKSTAANGQHTQFDDSGASPSASDVLSAWNYLVERFDAAKATLISSGIAAPTDMQVEAQMETDLRPIAGYTNNFMYLSK